MQFNLYCADGELVIVPARLQPPRSLRRRLYGLQVQGCVELRLASLTAGMYEDLGRHGFAYVAPDLMPDLAWSAHAAAA